MKEKVKICRFHGELTKDQIEKNREGNKVYKRCALCRKESRLKYNSKNREKNVKNASEWKRKNREKYNEWIRKDRKLNPEKYREYERKMRAKDPVKNNEIEIARRRGITREQYQEMIATQNELCAICHQPETRFMNGKTMRLTLDHCHKTNKLREFLCHSCNTGIGKFKDDIKLLHKAIEYIRKHQ